MKAEPTVLATYTDIPWHEIETVSAMDTDYLNALSVGRQLDNGGIEFFPLRDWLMKPEIRAWFKVTYQTGRPEESFIWALPVPSVVTDYLTKKKTQLEAWPYDEALYQSVYDKVCSLLNVNNMEKQLTELFKRVDVHHKAFLKSWKCQKVVGTQANDNVAM